MIVESVASEEEAKTIKSTPKNMLGQAPILSDQEQRTQPINQQENNSFRKKYFIHGGNSNAYIFTSYFL